MITNGTIMCACIIIASCRAHELLEEFCGTGKILTVILTKKKSIEEEKTKNDKVKDLFQKVSLILVCLILKENTNADE